MAPGFLDLRTGEEIGAGGGAEPVTEAVAANSFDIVDTPLAVQRLRTTFDAYQFDIPEAADYASVKLAEMGDRFLVLGVQSELDFVKDNTGVTTGAALDVAMSSNAAVSAAMTAIANSDVMAKEDVNGVGDHLDYAFDQFAVLSGATVTGYPRPSVGTGLYLNIQTSITVDGHVTLTGWIDVYYIDLGA